MASHQWKGSISEERSTRKREGKSPRLTQDLQCFTHQ